MRLVFLRITFVVSILVLVGVAVAIVFSAGAQWEMTSPAIQIAPPPTPTELPAAEKEIAERAKQYLREHAAEYSLRPDLADLKVLRVNTTPVADIVDFQQLYQGIPVEKSGINVVIPRDSKQSIQIGGSYNPRVILQSTTPPYPGQAVASPSAKVSASDAAARAWAAVGAKGKLFRPISPSLVVYPLEKPGQPPLYTLAWHIEISTVSPNGSWTVFVDAQTGQILFQKSTLQLDCANPPCDPNPPFTPRPTALPSRTPVPITPTSKTYSIPGWQSPTIPPPPSSKPSPQPLPVSPTDLLQPSDKIQFDVLPTPTPDPSLQRTPPIPPTSSGPKPPQPTAPTRSSQSPIRVAGTNALASWNTLMSENFESTWPTGLWQRWGDPTWGTTDYTARTGSKSAWCAASVWNPHYYYYPNNMNSWMVYGPIDLSRATSAYLNFSYWNQSELNYDFFGLVASVNGNDFYWVWWTSGDSGGWQDVAFDFASLPGMGNLIGQSNVWIALVFTSNDSKTDDGAFVDDVRIDAYIPTPNMTPYTPSGWASPLVPSSVTGMNYVDTLLTNGTTYVDWAISNNGDATANPFYVTLYLDGSPIAEWYVANLYSGGVASVVDWQMSFRPTPGWHLLRLVADSRGSVSESNEGDNVREEWFYWHAPNLTSFTPSGWDYPVVPSSVWGTYTVGNLFAGRDTYVDWAITNNGTVPAYNFYVRLYLDNVAFYELYINQLNPG